MKKKIIKGRAVPKRVAGARTAYTLDAAAALTGAKPELIRYFYSRGILATVSARHADEPVFDDDAIYELRRIEHYRRHYGANRSALAFIHGLLREVERLEAELRFRGHL